jgi:hypothetical protein
MLRDGLVTVPQSEWSRPQLSPRYPQVWLAGVVRRLAARQTGGVRHTAGAGFPQIAIIIIS